MCKTIDISVKFVAIYACKLFHV